MISSFSDSNYNKHLSFLLKLICDNHLGLQVCCFNARSLNSSKLDYLNDSLGSLNLDVVCVTETWYKRDFNDNMYSLNGFNIVRNDRKNDRRGGGIAIYCKNYLNVKTLYSSDASEPVESLFLEIGDGTVKALIICIYNPPGKCCLTNTFVKVNEYSSQYEHILLCGDLNADLLSPDAYTLTLLNNLSSSALSLINPINQPTRFAANCAPSLLDLMCASDVSNVIHFEQLSLSGISDHDMLCITYNLQFSKTIPETYFQYRDFKRINFGALYDECCSIPWNECWYLSDVNLKLEFFNTTVSYLFNKYVPERKVKVKNPRLPWFDSNVKTAISERIIKYSAWKRDPTADNWERYRRARNHVHTVTKDSKSRYFQQKLGSDLTTKTLWNNLKSIGVSSSVKQTCTLNADNLNDYFLSSDHFSSNSSTVFNENPIPDRQISFDFHNLSELDVVKSINSIKSNALGIDSISLKFIKIILPYIISTLTHIFNHCITSSTFPDNWKVAIVQPIAKNNSPKILQDYRPISILPALSKAFEKCLLNQITRRRGASHECPIWVSISTQLCHSNFKNF